MAVKSAYANIVLIGNKENINKMAVNHNQTVSLAGHNVSQFFFRFNKSNDGFLC